MDYTKNNNNSYHAVSFDLHSKKDQKHTKHTMKIPALFYQYQFLGISTSFQKCFDFKIHPLSH